jgi:hypothetical protein
MTVPTLRRPLSAWRFLLDALRALTHPRADIAECDRRVTALAADSALGRAGIAAVADFRRIAAGSTCWRALRDVLRRQQSRPLAERVRAAAAIAGGAAATTLALRPFTTERDPLTWVLPAVVAVVAALTWVLADAIARAIGDRRA